jgi:hypothetical protein
MMECEHRLYFCHQNRILKRPNSIHHQHIRKAAKRKDLNILEHQAPFGRPTMSRRTKAKSILNRHGFIIRYGNAKILNAYIAICSHCNVARTSVPKIKHIKPIFIVILHQKIKGTPPHNNCMCK